MSRVTTRRRETDKISTAQVQDEGMSSGKAFFLTLLKTKFVSRLDQDHERAISRDR